jgi:phosphoribosylformimino-5-aminoimidazole carboxamide ribotide isomerase
MEIYPAIDLMNGKVVRLTRGAPRTYKVYEKFGEPLIVARKWESEGADAIHIIDLDAALEIGSNTEMIKKIVNDIKVPTQVGGGIRKMQIAQNLLRNGVHRVILGTLAFSQPEVVTKLLEEFGNERVAIALDYCHGKVMVKGWKATTKLSVGEAITKFSDFGVKIFLLTSIVKDGTLTSPDYNMLSEVHNYPGISIIAAGGVSSLRDVVMLKQIGVRGVVIGKALYEGKFQLREAVEIARDKGCL